MIYEERLIELGAALEQKLPEVSFKFAQDADVWITEDAEAVHYLHTKFKNYAKYKDFLGFDDLIIDSNDDCFFFTID